MQSTCGYLCAMELAKEKAKEKQGKDKRKAIKQFKDNDIAVLKRLAQTLVNKYVRVRDNLQPCISCGFIPHYDKKGNYITRQWHASHYMPMGNNSAIRYDEDNIHKACSICNNHLSGNLIPYRIELIKKIGLEKVIFLETQKHPKKWSIEELNEIIAKYRNKLNAIKDLYEM